MSEFRVFATAGEAYRFLFREFGTILRLTWLPLLLVTLIQNFITITVLPDVVPGAGDIAANFATPSGLFGWVMIWVANAVGTAIAAVALHRVILFGEHRPGQFFYLHFGRTEWLFVVVSLAAIGLVALIFLVLLFLMPGWLLVLLSVFLIAVVVYFAVRFSLIFPIIVVEGRWDFEQSLQLTRGRFWRLFALGLVVIIPVVIVVGVLQHLAVFGSLTIDFDKMVAGMDTPTLIKVTILQFLSGIVFGALGVAILSYSYKALTGKTPDEVLSAQT